MQATPTDITTVSITATTIIHPVWHAIVVCIPMIPTSGTIATDGMILGTIPGTDGMDPTIATAMQAGTTGAGAGTTTVGTLPGTMEDTTEDTMVAIMADITEAVRLMPLVTSDKALPLLTGEQEEAG